ncbi:MAG: ImmA/IrrE family metallo-endopeptidase [Desulfovibrionaceae bacterium]|nr:ImmA/IrrE family metallo-endopeptidase [Desulfovibrionaceae bacterium]
MPPHLNGYHELGHIVLGHRTNASKKYTHTESKEQAANAFAKYLLMPTMAVRTMVEQRDMMFDELCTTFDVSEQAMAIRLTELRLV